MSKSPSNPPSIPPKSPLRTPIDLPGAASAPIPTQPSQPGGAQERQRLIEAAGGSTSALPELEIDRSQVQPGLPDSDEDILFGGFSRLQSGVSRHGILHTSRSRPLIEESESDNPGSHPNPASAMSRPSHARTRTVSFQSDPGRNPPIAEGQLPNIETGDGAEFDPFRPRTPDDTFALNPFSPITTSSSGVNVPAAGNSRGSSNTPRAAPAVSPARFIAGTTSPSGNSSPAALMSSTAFPQRLGTLPYHDPSTTITAVNAPGSIITPHTLSRPAQMMNDPLTSHPIILEHSSRPSARHTTSVPAASTFTSAAAPASALGHTPTPPARVSNFIPQPVTSTPPRPIPSSFLSPSAHVAMENAKISLREQQQRDMARNPRRRAEVAVGEDNPQEKQGQADHRQRRPRRPGGHPHRRDAPFRPKDPYQFPAQFSASPIPPILAFARWALDAAETRLGVPDQSSSSSDSTKGSKASKGSRKGEKDGQGNGDPPIPMQPRPQRPPLGAPGSPTPSAPAGPLETHSSPGPSSSHDQDHGPPKASPANVPASDPGSPRPKPSPFLRGIPFPPELQKNISDTERAVVLTLRQYSAEVLKQTYRHLLLRLPSLYFNRVGRVILEADLSAKEVDSLIARANVAGPNDDAARLLDRRSYRRGFGGAGGDDEDDVPLLSQQHSNSPSPNMRALRDLETGSYYPGSIMQPDNATIATNTESIKRLERFRLEWENFIDSVVKEWKTLNVVSALLLTALLTVFQIQEAAFEPVTRTAALLSLVSAFMSILFGGVYIIRFSTMRTMRKAARWAAETRKESSKLLWNIWILLALPAAWLAYSMIFFSIALLGFVWTSGTGKHEQPVSDNDYAAVILGPRIGITVLFLIGFIYFGLVLNTFRSWSGVSVGASEPITRLVQQSLGVGAGALGIASQEGTPLFPPQPSLPGVPEGSGSGGSTRRAGVHPNPGHETFDVRSNGSHGSPGGGSILGLELGQQAGSPSSGSSSKGKGRVIPLPGGNVRTVPPPPPMQQTEHDLWGSPTIPANPQPFKREEQEMDLDQPLPPPNSPPELSEFGTLPFTSSGGLTVGSAANLRTGGMGGGVRSVIPPPGSGSNGAGAGVAGGVIETPEGGVAEFNFGNTASANSDKRGKKGKDNDRTKTTSTDEGKKGLGALRALFK